MGMRINTNLDALNAQRNLATTGLAYSKSVAKLSSGLRINSAADDAAGLSISEKLRSQTMGLAQASRNAQDGISLIQTGEGALNEASTMLQRMRELTVQGGNDTLQAADRSAIKSELDQLSSEINRISNTTQFNGVTLLNGALTGKGTLTSFNNAAAGNLTGFTASALNVSAPVGSAAAVRSGTAAAVTITSTSSLAINGFTVNFTTGDTTAQAVTDINNTAGLGSTGAVTASLVGGVMTLTSNAKGAAATVSLGASTGAILTDLSLVQGSSTGYDAPPASTPGTYGITITQGATSALATGGGTVLAGGVTSANGVGTLVVNGVNVLVTAGASYAIVAASINSAGAGVTATIVAGAAGFKLTSNDKGAAAATITSTGLSTNLLLSDLGLATVGQTQAVTGGVSNLAAAAGLGAAGTYSANGGAAVAFTAKNGTTLTGGGIQIDARTLTAGAVTTLNTFAFTDTSNALNLQIGANSGQTLSVGIESMSATTLGVGNLDVSSSTAVNTAGTGTLALIDLAIASVSAQRATLGAYQNRLEHTIANLGVSESNLTASESRIRDVDMAAEMVNFTKTGILQQAGQAILAQANQSGSGVMSLLR